MRRLRQAINSANRAAQHANNTLGLADALILEIQDGIQLELVRTGDNTIMQFLRGECDTLPIKIRVVIDEDE